MCLSRIVWSVARGSRTVLLARSGAACPCISSPGEEVEKERRFVQGARVARGTERQRAKAGRGLWGGGGEKRGEGNDGGKKDCSAKERGAARVIMLRSSTVPRR